MENMFCKLCHAEKCFGKVLSAVRQHARKQHGLRTHLLQDNVTKYHERVPVEQFLASDDS